MTNAPALPEMDMRSLTRRLAQARVSQLPALIQEARAGLAGAPPEWIAGRAATLLAHHFRPDDPEHLTEAVIFDWIDALSIYPQWAIEDAVRRWNRTGGGKKPAPGHICALCERAVAPVRAELATARRILDRLEPSPQRVSSARAMEVIAAAQRGAKCG